MSRGGEWERTGSGALKRGGSILLQGPFALYWSSGVVSASGTWTQIVGISVLIYSLTGSSAWVGLYNAMYLAPILLSSVVGGWLADRMHRRTIVVSAHVGASSVGWVLLALHFMDALTPLVLVGAALAAGIFVSMGKPALAAFWPLLLQKHEYERGAALNSLQFNLGQVVGSALGSWLLLRGGFTAIFVINAVSYLAPAAAVLRINVPRAATANDSNGVSLFGGVRELASFIRQRFDVGASLAGLILANMTMESIRVLAPSWSATHLGSERYAGLIFTSISVGSSVGLILFGYLNTRRLVTFERVHVIALVQAVSLATLAWVTLPMASYLVAATAGLCYAFMIALFMGRVQMAADERIRGRLMGAMMASHLGVRPIASSGMGAFGALVGVATAFAVGGAAATAAALSIGLGIRRYVRRQLVEK